MASIERAARKQMLNYGGDLRNNYRNERDEGLIASICTEQVENKKTDPCSRQQSLGNINHKFPLNP